MTFSLTMLFPQPRGGHRRFARAPRVSRPRASVHSASIDPAVPSLPIGFAQFAPQDLPRDVARDGADEIDRLRGLEMGDALTRPGDDAGRVLGRAWFQSDERL